MAQKKPNYIIGTAGHIDHGKTALIKALTGTNTDRLKEEQERGITIELGFAFFEGTDGHRYGIVDVPGHEKFIPTMLSGAYGFDVVMMVIAADDGIKPQTMEHFEILHLLRVPRAMFVITKIDMVEPSRIEEVKEEIEILTHGSYLADSRIIPASSIKGDGLDDVRAEISRLVGEGIPREKNSYFRFPIDRVFTITGFGTVTTGTVFAGSTSVDDEVIMLPQKRKLRVRNVEVHGDNARETSAGQRAAINLPRIEKSEIHRGMELISPELSEQIYSRYYAWLEMLPNKACRIKNFSRVRLFKGTMETVVTLVNVSDDRFAPKGKYVVDMSSKEEFLINSGERFIIRDETNKHTLGGGEFLVPSSLRRSKISDDLLDDLIGFPDYDLGDKIRTQLKFSASTLVPASFLVSMFNRPLAEINTTANLMAKVITKIPGQNASFALTEKLDEKKALIENTVRKFHEENKNIPGIDKNTLRDLLRINFAGESELHQIWSILIQEGKLKDEGEYIKHEAFVEKFSQEDAQLKSKITAIYSDFTANTPKKDKLQELLGVDQKTVNRIFSTMIKAKELILLKGDAYASMSAFTEVENKAIKYLEQHGEITVAQFRDLIGTNRNLAVMFLETMDSRAVTQRKDNVRVLWK